MPGKPKEVVGEKSVHQAVLRRALIDEKLLELSVGWRTETLLLEAKRAKYRAGQESDTEQNGCHKQVFQCRQNLNCKMNS